MKEFVPKSNTKAALLVYTIFVVFSLGFSANAMAGEIEFTYVPPYGSSADLCGQVFGVDPNVHKVAVYIYVYGWWTKPTWGEPLTSIDSDSTWVCDITTGGMDSLATKIIAFLVPDGYNPPLGNGESSLPSELYNYPYAEAIRDPVDRTISFAGYNWSVKKSDAPVGPGPNYFSDSEENIWVDANDHLHLKIAQRDGNWYCSEVIVDASPGYGIYVFTVKGRVDLLDENIILGMFTWDSYAPEYNYREIDVEIGRWWHPENDNAQFAVSPWGAGDVYRFDIDLAGHPDETTTHAFTWKPNGIYFRSYYGDFSLAPAEEDIIASWYYTGSDNPPAGGENARINFWLLPPEGSPPGTPGAPPNNGEDAEIVIKSFQHLSDVSDRPGDLNNDNDVDLADFALFASGWLDTGCSAWNNWCGVADLTCDGQVGMEDLEKLTANWLAGL